MIDPLFDWTKPQQIDVDGAAVNLRPMAMPPCYNRPARGEWIDTGRTSELVKRELWPGDGFLAGPEDRMTFVRRPVLRWKWPWFVDRCAAWDSGPSPINEAVPARERWRCEGCCWLPESAKAYMARC